MTDTCLFCGKDTLRMYRLPDSESRHLFCDSCGAAGPWGETPEEARRLYEAARPCVKQTCSQCNGSGFEGEAQSPCSFCGGDGWLPATATNEYTAFLESETAKAQTGRCPNCNAGLRPLHCCVCEGCDGCREHPSDAEQLIELRKAHDSVLRDLKQAAFAYHVEANHKPSAFADCRNGICANACRVFNARVESNPKHPQKETQGND